MTSDAKIESNRRNALKSTGPRTERGKERSRLNALRHGLTARQLVATSEDYADFARFNAELRAALAPGDAVEEQLVEGIVMTSWRLRRAWRTEAAAIQVAARRSRRWEEPKLAVPFALAGRDVERVSRYETALQRSLQSAYAMLEQRKARRAEAASAAPPTTEAGLG
jgi:hypothetical protein